MRTPTPFVGGRSRLQPRGSGVHPGVTENERFGTSDQRSRRRGDPRGAAREVFQA